MAQGGHDSPRQAENALALEAHNTNPTVPLFPANILSSEYHEQVQRSQETQRVGEEVSTTEGRSSSNGHMLPLAANAVLPLRAIPAPK